MIRIKSRRTVGYYVGTGLMVLGIAGCFWTFYPIIREDILYQLHFKQITDATIDTTYSVTIPSIGVQSAVIAGVDPFKPKIYREALQHGVAQALGTALPGQKGTQYIFAHSSEAPWRMTRDNTAFFRLGRIHMGDQIIITYQGKKYFYKVSEMKTVWPSDTQYLKQTQNQLILQTCTPIGTDWKRLLIFANPS